MAKFGIRKPSVKKSFSARTTGRAKRKMKSSVNPFYGKKGTGAIRNPKKSTYNKVYNKTTYDGLSPLKNKSKSRATSTKSDYSGCLTILCIAVVASIFIAALPYLLIIGVAILIGVIVSKIK